MLELVNSNALSFTMTPLDKVQLDFIFILKLKQLYHVYYTENYNTLLHGKYLLTMKNYSTKLPEIYLIL